MIDQLTVFLENSEGRLAALCRVLAEAQVNMYALTIADTTDYGIVRIICDDPEKAVNALSEQDYRAVVTKVAAIGVPNEPGGLAKLLDLLDELDINIEYGYCFSIKDDMAVDVLKIHAPEQADEAAAALEAAGFKILQASDII